MDITVDAPRVSTDEIVEALARLVRQISRSAPPVTRASLDAILSDPATTLLVARAGDRVVGTLTLVSVSIPTGTRTWIEDVVVDAEARGWGVGSALTHEALRLAREAGARTVDLTSRPARTAANRLYQRIGFEVRDTNVYRFTMPSSEG